MPPPPVITNIGASDGSLTVSEGTLVGINGQNFVPCETTVIFSGGIQASLFNGSTGSEDLLLVTVPVGALSGPVLVTAPGGFVISEQQFTIQ